MDIQLSKELTRLEWNWEVLIFQNRLPMAPVLNNINSVLQFIYIIEMFISVIWHVLH
jgi:hypothetical protein